MSLDSNPIKIIFCRLTGVIIIITIIIIIMIMIIIMIIIIIIILDNFFLYKYGFQKGFQKIKK